MVFKLDNIWAFQLWYATSLSHCHLTVRTSLAGWRYLRDACVQSSILFWLEVLCTCLIELCWFSGSVHSPRSTAVNMVDCFTVYTLVRSAACAHGSRPRQLDQHLSRALLCDSSVNSGRLHSS